MRTTLRFERVIEAIARWLRADRSLIAPVMATRAEDPHETASDSAGPDDDDAAPPSEHVPPRSKPDHADG